MEAENVDPALDDSHARPACQASPTPSSPCSAMLTDELTADACVGAAGDAWFFEDGVLVEHFEGLEGPAPNAPRPQDSARVPLADRTQEFILDMLAVSRRPAS
jgi:hypothetical protein